MINGRLKNVSDFEKIIVKSVPATGEIVYLKDVARVELGRFTYANNSFIDDKKASILTIYQTPGSNALQTATGIIKELDQLKKQFPADVDYKIPYETVTVVKVSMKEVVETLLIALCLVALVVYLFLQNWRATLIPVLAIPVSILGTFAFFVPLDFTINTLTMFGFVLAIGIVVDDAIIVVEAVQHYMEEEKMDVREATYHAMDDISAPVVAIALILASVFIPVSFMPGIVGRLYQQFAITISVSILLSAFIALSLTPALCILMLKPYKIDKSSKGLDRFFFKFNGWFHSLNKNYTLGVQKGIKNSRFVIILLVCVGLATIYLFHIKPGGFIPNEDDGLIYITFELPEATSTSQSVHVMTQLMNVVKTIPGIEHYAALTGFNVITGATKSNSGTLYCQLKPWDERKTESQRIPKLLDVIRNSINKAQIKNANIEVITPAPIPGIGQTAGFSFQIEQKNTNDDPQAFEKVVNNFLAEAKKNPAISNAFSYFSAHTPSYNLNVDREKCKKMGVNISDVFQAIQTYMGSVYVNDFTLYNRTFHVVVQADSSYRKSVTNMDNYYVKNQAGTMLPLSTLITYKPSETASLLSHFNIFRSAEIDGSPAEGYSSGQTIEALQDIAARVLPSGYGYDFSGLSYEEIQAGTQTFFIFLFSLSFVFLFLAALYENWSVPFAVLLAVPVGAFGAILALSFVPGLTNNIYAQIGLITLIGLAAKNAILIVEYAKVRVDKGEDLVKATLEAVSLRLRPILMTSLAFILGIMPLVLATGAGAVARRTIGLTVLGGMIAASSLAIFVVPILFTVIIRITRGKKKLQ
jgi:HAE1 family hydrophobic/amphiphilic exporter-1